MREQLLGWGYTNHIQILAVYFTTFSDTCAMAFLCYMLKVVPLRREHAL